MPRYANDYHGISAQPEGTRGLDPNHRGAYRGMRMQGGRGMAPYGWYRWTHETDLETSGGFRGSYGGGAAAREERFDNFRPRYDRDLGGAGVHDARYDTEYLRDFNSRSIRFQEDLQGSPRRENRGRYGGEYDDRDSPRSRRYDNGIRRGYANRGMTEAGYAESWAWGPMRGAR
ncbi:hypothetical protein BH23GEM6_BH23GEM6_16150 [soil metagenome]